MTSVNLDQAVKFFKSIPYRQSGYKSRSWGHPFHFLLSYPSKLKPAIAYFLVKTFTQPGEVVLDTFSGVGTVPFEACSQGRMGIGSDISPIGYHATRAKVNPPKYIDVKKQIIELEKYIEKKKNEINHNVEEEIVDYYHEETLKEILCSKEFFKQKNEENLNYSFLITCVLHILHGNRPYALSRRSHNIMPWPPKGPFKYKSLIKSLTEKVERSYKKPLPMNFTFGESYQYDVFKMGFKDESMDCILTSPPFHQSRDFVRMNRIRLWFCGWDYEYQKNIKDDFLESNKKIDNYEEILNEFHRVLKKNSICILHTGVVKKFNMAEEISALKNDEEFTEIAIIYEDTSDLENHGIVDSGATHKHQFLILKKIK